MGSALNRAYAGTNNVSFTIHPYLHFGQRGEIKISYRYYVKPTRPGGRNMRIYNNGERIAELEPTIKKGLHTVTLPITCGFGTGYGYYVDGMGARESIAPIPCPDDKGPLKITFITDTQDEARDARKVMEMAQRRESSFVILTGDLVQTGDASNNWTMFFWAMQPLINNRPLLPIIGNHEYRGTTSAPPASSWDFFFQIPAKDAHSAHDFANTRIISLNSCFEDDPSQIQGQLQWLEQALSADKRWKIVALHHPPYGASIFHSPLYPKQEFAHLRKHYVPLFERYGVKLVLAGHTHLLEHSKKEGIHYFTGGPAGGKMIRPVVNNPYEVFPAKAVRSYSQLTITEDKIQVDTDDIRGRPVYSFSIH
jgi:predicted phosphodiesterase